MPLSAKSVRKQLELLNPLLNNCSLETIRKGQNKLGELFLIANRKNVIIQEHKFENFCGAWIIPKDERRHGVIMYLHGGGYTAGDLDYAKGFGTKLALETGARVFCAAYRLAPEHKFPCALDDALEAYKYLLDKGFSKIVVSGESAGGGLILSLCVKLKEAGIKLPNGIIAISPWTDMTSSGESYTENKEKDPSMTKEKLGFFAKSYTDDIKNPLVSPLFADLKNFPPTLIFAGGDEIMLSDSVLLNEKLVSSGVDSKLIVGEKMWHAYLVYDLNENKKDFNQIQSFLTKVGLKEHRLRWMRLDNAAKIYPAARRQNWSNVFRLSATLYEDVDIDVLKNALDVTVRRFPSIAARLRKGLFWYYLQQLDKAPEIKKESSYPLTRMSKEETRKCALRVIVYKKRIAIEFFHSLTDGNGAMVFLKSLVAEYIEQKHNIVIPSENGILDRLEKPDEGEFEDCFVKHKGLVKTSRNEDTAWRLTGTDEPAGFLNLTCFKIPVKEVLKKAHDFDASLTTFLCASIMMALQNLQKEMVPKINKRKPIKVLIPVNLRKLFKSNTLRNFVFYTTPEIEPMLGEYSFGEICKVIANKMGQDITQKQMSKRIAANVESEQKLILRVMPLFIKNIVMKAIFNAVGERKSCLTLSNIGAITIPENMAPYVERFDFILGIQATAPYNCGVLSYKDTLYVNFIRNIREPFLERKFFEVLRDMGIPVTVESNKQ